jgi:hypothetical protein
MPLEWAKSHLTLYRGLQADDPAPADPDHSFLRFSFQSVTARRYGRCVHRIE